MIRRSYDAAEINWIINHPDVFKWVAITGQEYIDLQPNIDDRRNVLLMADGGGLYFHQLESGIYEVHTQFLPHVRGIYAAKATRSSVHWMFINTDCMELLTKVPAHNKAADFWARWIGGKLDFERKNAWATADGDTVDVKYYGLRYYDWVRNSSSLDKSGHWFHEKLGEHVTHDDDPAHDRHVGAAVEMIKAGQLAKAIVLYNRWAKFSGYEIVEVVSTNPIIIDIVDCLILVQGDDFKRIEKENINMG